MNLLKFFLTRNLQKSRLVSNPVYVHLLSGYAFHRHGNISVSIVLLDVPVVVFSELSQLVTVGMFFLVFIPEERDVHLAARRMYATVVFTEVRKICFLPSDLLLWIEQFFHSLGILGFQVIQCQTGVIKHPDGPLDCSHSNLETLLDCPERESALSELKYSDYCVVVFHGLPPAPHGT